MAKTGKSTARKTTASKAKASGRQTKSKVISKAKSAKSTTVPASPAVRKSASPKQKWAAPYEKKINMYKTQGDYFALNQKYSNL